MGNKKVDFKLQFRRKDTGETIEEYISADKGNRPSKTKAMRMVLSRPGYMMLSEKDVETLRMNKVNEREVQTSGIIDESAFGF